MHISGGHCSASSSQLHVTDRLIALGPSVCPAFVRWEQRGLGQEEPDSTSSPYLHAGRSYGHSIFFQSLLLPFGPTLHLPW